MSWLFIAEIELYVMTCQCLSRMINDIDLLRQKLEAWESDRNGHMSASDGDSLPIMLGNSVHHRDIDIAKSNRFTTLMWNNYHKLAHKSTSLDK